ncbi:MAG: hypothetical protein LBB94_03120 [Clostridiales bacterium]|jgi:hypothetical protein|nr:hypothetical protein [Clostridiales bacterium]
MAQVSVLRRRKGAKQVISMEYISARQAAKQRVISGRRARIPCGDGSIPGAVNDGKSYKIPGAAVKPPGGREKKAPSAAWLKWDGDVVGTIDSANAVTFTRPEYNNVVSLYTKGAKRWTPEQFAEFLSERAVSRSRRDIERILFRCGLSQYDVLRISEITRGIHPKDLLWIAHSKNEKLESAMTGVFQSVFLQKTDQAGDSIDTPEGYNIKRYGVYNGQYGIFKQRISPLATDAESEAAVYLLARKFGVPCCPAYKTGKDTVFSAFLYDFSKEYIVHFRRLFEGARGDNEYRNLITARPQYRDGVARMILLDFITRQDDRHLSNIAVKISGREESFYPLYDNGRSLFYEDTEEMAREAVADPALYATGFGFSGTYWDYAQEIAKEPGGLRGLLNLEVSRDDIAGILRQAGFVGYRFYGALEWIEKTVGMLLSL